MVFETMHPAGLGDAVMKCQNIRTDDPGTLRNGGVGVSLGENADTAARIRNDARVGAGVAAGRLTNSMHDEKRGLDGDGEVGDE
ncbi:hypothetical protein [Streptomyces melanogenes]|uniref:hypothetical protein n=1 Tax=Streptomyces melanogenes TaxID=67326 RepID=UPI0037BD99C7